MSDFIREFLNEDWGNRAQTPRIFMGAFGKHPGWNDHMDDVGLATHSLATLRRVLYGSGIATQIESSAWENQESGKILAQFDHVFCWSRPAEVIFGKIWTSRDGKGRSLYPMILAAHCVNVPFDAVARHLLPVLDHVAAECRSSTTASEVISAIDRGQTEVRKLLKADESGQKRQSTLGIPAWTHYFERHRPELLRLFYHLLVQFQPFRPDSSALWATDTTQNRSRHLRLPALPGTKPDEAFHSWICFLGTQLDLAAPILAVAPAARPWLDVVVGEPIPSDFFVLRAGPDAAPLVTEIPYQIEPEIARRLEPVFTSLQSKELPAFSVLDEVPADTNQLEARRWLARQRPSGRGFFNRMFRAS